MFAKTLYKLLSSLVDLVRKSTQKTDANAFEKINAILVTTDQELPLDCYEKSIMLILLAASINIIMHNHFMIPEDRKNPNLIAETCLKRADSILNTLPDSSTIVDFKLVTYALNITRALINYVKNLNTNVDEAFINKTTSMFKFELMKQNRNMSNRTTCAKTYNNIKNKFEKIKFTGADKKKLLISYFLQVAQKFMAETIQDFNYICKLPPSHIPYIPFLMNVVKFQVGILKASMEDHYIEDFRNRIAFLSYKNIGEQKQSLLISLKSELSLIIYIYVLMYGVHGCLVDCEVNYLQASLSAEKIKIFHVEEKAFKNQDDIAYYQTLLNQINNQIRINDFRTTNVYNELIAIEKYKKKSFSRILLGRSYTQLHSKKEAQKVVKPSNPENVNATKDMAYQYFLDGNFSKAVKLYNHDLDSEKKDFNRAKLLICIGECYLYWSKLQPPLQERLLIKSREYFSKSNELILNGIALSEEQVKKQEWEMLVDLHRDLLAFLDNQTDISEINILQQDENTPKIEELEKPRVVVNDNCVIENTIPLFGNLREVIFESAKNIINAHLKENHLIFVVGGFVRDWLLNIAPADCDLVTSAFPNQSKNLFPESSSLYGKNFPLLASEGVDISIFRGHKRGGKVTLDDGNSYEFPFGESVNEDHTFRDITINAVYYDPKNNVLIDPTGRGMNDISNRIIRMINSDPLESFKEDAIRILRVIRFSKNLNFKIDPETEKILTLNVATLSTANPSRVLLEFKKIFQAKENKKIFFDLYARRIIDVLFKHASKEVFLYNDFLDSTLVDCNKEMLGDSLVFLILLLGIFYQDIMSIKNIMTLPLGNKAIILLVDQFVDDIIIRNKPYFIKPLKLDVYFKNVILNFYFPTVMLTVLSLGEKIVLDKLNNCVNSQKYQRKINLFSQGIDPVPIAVKEFNTFKIS